MNTANCQIYIKTPREESNSSFLNCCLDLNFDILHAATGSRYAAGNDIGLVNLGPIALFSSHKLTTGSGKHLKESSHAHIVSLMYKLITSARSSDDLSIGFDRDCGKRQQDLTNNGNIKGKHHVKIMPWDDFGFVEHQENATYDLEYKITKTEKVITPF